MSTAAFFDLDDTFAASLSLMLIGKGLGRAHRCENAVALVGSRLAAPIRRWAGLPSDNVPQGSILHVMAGHTPDEGARWAAGLATQEILPRVHPQIVDLVARNAAAGHRTVLVTRAPHILATAVAAALGIDEVLASDAEIGADGRYTGRTAADPLDGPGKLHAAQTFATAHGVDLAISHVYSDRGGSAGLLAAAGFKHVVNPTGDVAAMARAQGWPVHQIRPVHWLWATEVPWASIALAAGSFAAGYAVRGRRTPR
ncbi:MAG: HAD family hydrolase [Nostocoides sp.]